jgi:phosphoserine phosphatase RsbU/P
VIEYKSIPEELVKEEFHRSTKKAHVLVCWIGISLNLLWSISDYFVIPNNWIVFFIIRFAVSSICSLLLFFREKISMSIFTCVFILAMGISIQNAYMWSVMDIHHFQKHTFAYLALFIGVGMLVLWDFKLSLILLTTTILANLLFYTINSNLTIDQVLINGGLLTLTVAIFSVFLIKQRYNLIYSEIKSRLELNKSKNYIQLQKEEVDDKNQELLSSLRYAKRLQEAMLAPKNLMYSFFNENYFILYNPRDIVCGDFYWAKEITTTPLNGHSKSYFLLAVADCTGHGVPGAFMSVLGSSFLNQSSIEKNINTPAEALDYLNQQIVSTLNHGHRDEEIRDGMDIALIALDLENKQLAYAGANNAIYIVRNNELTTLKADKQAIGNVNSKLVPFTNNEFQLQEGDCIYLFTDGYADQFGGPKGKKLMRKQFEETLIQNSSKAMLIQKEELEATFNNWKGALNQVDDVCVVGVRI